MALYITPQARDTVDDTVLHADIEIDQDTKSIGSFERGKKAGERNVNSNTNDYQNIRDECNLTMVDIQTAITIGAGAADDTHLIGLYLSVAITGTIVITGFEGSAGTAISITIPAATPAGFIDFKGARNSKGALTVTASNAADDNDIAIFWRPI